MLLPRSLVPGLPEYRASKQSLCPHPLVLCLHLRREISIGVGDPKSLQLSWPVALQCLPAAGPAWSVHESLVAFLYLPSWPARMGTALAPLGYLESSRCSLSCHFQASWGCLLPLWTLQSHPHLPILSSRGAPPPASVCGAIKSGCLVQRQKEPDYHGCLLSNICTEFKGAPIPMTLLRILHHPGTSGAFLWFFSLPPRGAGGGGGAFFLHCEPFSYLYKLS